MFCFFCAAASGMDILNGAIDSLISSSNKEDWTPVALNVADATVTISKDTVRHAADIAYIFLSSFLLHVLKIKRVLVIWNLPLQRCCQNEQPFY